MLLRSITAAVVLAATTAQAQIAPANDCGPYGAIIERLSSVFGEEMVAYGLISSEVRIEIWASRRTGSATILYRNGEGVACLKAAPTDFQIVPALPNV